MKEYQELKKRLARGWNTWNTRSVLSHTLLPEGFAINLGIKEYRSGHYLKEALIGRQGDGDEKIHPGMHAYDGSYTELNLKWQDIEINVESAVEEGNLVVLITTLENQIHPATLVVEPGILWNREGYVKRDGDVLSGCLPNKKIDVYATGEKVVDAFIAVQTPYLALRLTDKIGISTDKRRNVEEIEKIIAVKKSIHMKTKERYGESAELYNAMQSCLAWDTIYDPSKDRVVTPVTRIWNVDKGGYALFCWDTYFAAYMLLVDNKELAYANAIEITREKTEQGFIPNFAWGNGMVSRDRSQPPVGSLTVRELYRKYGDRWLLEELFDELYNWNRWFISNRSVGNGTLAWGSNPYQPFCGNYWEAAGVGDTFGGALESGLDNSPMYDDIPFNKEKAIMELSDVGLTGLYILDCHALAEIADILGKEAKSGELRKSAEECEEGLKTLWNQKNGFFLNRRTDTGLFSTRISPTNFYALFGNSVTQEQADAMIKKHFLNPGEFWGEYIIPSISRNDPAYADQDYWRGRIWAPMNFLVYIGLRYHGLADAQKELAERSRKLLLKEWLEHGHVHENYSGDTGEGCDKPNSDRFYHWGALLSLIVLMEEGFVDGPESPLL